MQTIKTYILSDYQSIVNRVLRFWKNYELENNLFFISVNVKIANNYCKQSSKAIRGEPNS